MKQATKTAIFVVLTVIVLAIDVVLNTWISAPIDDAGWFAGAFDKHRLLVNLGFVLLGAALAITAALVGVRKDRRTQDQSMNIHKK